MATTQPKSPFGIFFCWLAVFSVSCFLYYVFLFRFFMFQCLFYLLSSTFLRLNVCLKGFISHFCFISFFYIVCFLVCEEMEKARGDVSKWSLTNEWDDFFCKQSNVKSFEFENFQSLKLIEVFWNSNSFYLFVKLEIFVLNYV